MLLPSKAVFKIFFKNSHTADHEMFVWRCVSKVDFIGSGSQGHWFLHLTRITQSADLTNQGAPCNKFLPIKAAMSSIKVITPNHFLFNVEDLDLGFHFLVQLNHSD